MHVCTHIIGRQAFVMARPQIFNSALENKNSKQNTPHETILSPTQHLTLCIYYLAADVVVNMFKLDNF